MEQNTSIEEKLKLENDIATLRRELKNILAQTTGAKSEYNSIVGLIDSNKKLLEEQKEYLVNVQNVISQAKLDWMQERNQEMDKLAEKSAEAENIIKRKGELNEQEETIRKLEANDIEVRNETRRLELKVQEDMTGVKAKERALEIEKDKLEERENKLLKDVQNFKEKVAKVLKEVEKI